MWQQSAQFALIDRTCEKKPPSLFTGLPHVCITRANVARARGAPVLAFASVSFAQPGCRTPRSASSIQSSRILIHEGRNIERVESDGTWRRENIVGRKEDEFPIIRWFKRVKGQLDSAFFPEEHEVTPDYWQWWKLRLGHRFFSQVNMMFATQSLLYSLGIGASKTLAASAAVNWMLKEGLGKAARMGVSTSFAQNLDSDIKRVRYSAAIIFGICLGAEYMTPYMPHLFVLLAGISNIGKAVAIAAYTSTKPAILQSFARNEHLSDVAARGQAQNMVVDQMAIATAVAFTWAIRHSPRWKMMLPLVMYCVCTVGDFTFIHKELKSIQLRTLNRVRAEMLLTHHLHHGRVLTPSDVASKENLLFPSVLDAGALPVKVSPVTCMFSNIATLKNSTGELARQRFCVRLAPQQEGGSSESWQSASGRGKSKLCLRVAFRKDATSDDVMMALLAACEARRSLHEMIGVSTGDKRRGSTGNNCDWGRIWDEGGGATTEASGRIRAAEKYARRDIKHVKKSLVRGGWLCDHVLLSQSERVRYSVT